MSCVPIASARGDATAGNSSRAGADPVRLQKSVPDRINATPLQCAGRQGPVLLALQLRVVVLSVSYVKSSVNQSINGSLAKRAAPILQAGSPVQSAARI